MRRVYFLARAVLGRVCVRVCVRISTCPRTRMDALWSSAHLDAHVHVDPLVRAGRVRRAHGRVCARRDTRTRTRPERICARTVRVRVRVPGYVSARTGPCPSMDESVHVRVASATTQARYRTVLRHTPPYL